MGRGLWLPSASRSSCLPFPLEGPAPSSKARPLLRIPRLQGPCPPGTGLPTTPLRALCPTHRAWSRQVRGLAIHGFPSCPSHPAPRLPVCRCTCLLGPSPVPLASCLLPLILPEAFHSPLYTHFSLSMAGRAWFCLSSVPQGLARSWDSGVAQECSSDGKNEWTDRRLSSWDQVPPASSLLDPRSHPPQGIREPGPTLHLCCPQLTMRGNTKSESCSGHQGVLPCLGT